MGEEEKYIREINRYNKPGLCRLWKRHLENKMDASQKEFWKDGKLLEYTVLRGFELEGASVTWPYTVALDDENVEQIDGAIVVEGMHVLLECKDHNSNINIEPFAKMRNQLLRRPSGVIGCIFARKAFTSPAVALARFAAPQAILLWTGTELEYCLEHDRLIDGLKLKMKKAVEEFDYCYNVRAFYEIPKIV